MFIVVNKVQVPAAHREAVEKAFEQAMPTMKQFKGFLGLELWTGEDNALQAISRWESKEAMEEYIKNDTFQQHHGAGSEGGGGTYYTGRVLE